MQYVLALVIYSSTCTLNEIATFICEPKAIDYTDIIGTRDQCEDHTKSDETKELINENYSKVWVVPHCETYTREVAQRIKYYSEGI